ncbi:Zn(2)-C6 fungal-type domain-containing protein [Mycena kentingensis (nom. inval.)]|nr:Zn(2)-C6 fungal-type domain-containing protein [Mycena kentingensis (nom. inval.)]
MMAHPIPGPDSPFAVPKRVLIACTSCRRSKVKCLSISEDAACMGCQLKGIECEYRRIQYGRQRRPSSTAAQSRRASHSVSGNAPATGNNRVASQGRRQHMQERDEGLGLLYPPVPPLPTGLGLGHGSGRPGMSDTSSATSASQSPTEIQTILPEFNGAHPYAPYQQRRPDREPRRAGTSSNGGSPLVPPSLLLSSGDDTISIRSRTVSASSTHGHGPADWRGMSVPAALPDEYDLRWAVPVHPFIAPNQVQSPLTPHDRGAGISVLARRQQGPGCGYPITEDDQQQWGFKTATTGRD